MDKKTLGLKIRQARRDKKWTQEYLAEKADISVIYIGEIERGIKMPSLNVFLRIVEAMNISVDYLLRDEISSAKMYVMNDITEKLERLTPQQRKTVSDIIDAYLKNISELN